MHHDRGRTFARGRSARRLGTRRESGLAIVEVAIEEWQAHGVWSGVCKLDVATSSSDCTVPVPPPSERKYRVLSWETPFLGFSVRFSQHLAYPLSSRV